MNIDIPKARSFVDSIDLSGTPRGIAELGAAEDAAAVFDESKNQARVVGSSVFSFVQGVTAEVRESISDSALLAQLVANKRVKSEVSPLEWFTVYTEVLQNLGWVIQDSAWTEYATAGVTTEVHEKIIEVLIAALGPAPAFASIITTTASALKAMDANSSWMTLFNREVQKGNIPQFHIGLVDRDPNGDILVSGFAFLIQAEHAITQVLFFKLRSANAKFEAKRMTASINPRSLTDLSGTIRKKVRDYQVHYLSSIHDLDV